MTRPWLAPAKINLFLHVVGQRLDGYHLLQTAFQFVAYGDRLTFRVTGDGRVSRRPELAGIAEADDLSVRAAQLLRASSGVSQGVEIELHKRLPLGGGLGGGSSDAATTLLVLNQLWGTGLSRPELAVLGLQLGADVPVFVHGQAAWAEGVGELLTPIEPPEGWLVVVCPAVNVATARVFADPELTRNSPPITIRDLYAGRARNDLLPVVKRLYPQVGSVLQWLSGFGQTNMTGSGGCVYLMVADATMGQGILEQCPADCRGFVARTINRHPLAAGNA